ncbi:O-acetyl-ADP-ribose deacetylase [Variovorax sp. LjRoot290]|uniref:O-acetyl-ADP-ribose deacetylase n=1 Tax=unclassified Variovorax TaxID=663243 RepID=UPI00088F1B59|nr:O-acetyl-ADP-ribose deacetylase [Variovorax sp. CF079]SDE88257.1 O-acetyl-ADP-ribose deacetylase (regulator of RNase III), contains Macro domain [Variovorax sp. CF079]
MATRLRAIKADITKLQVDVIVNAANSKLLGGGGVDGAIHSAAGPELLEACRALGGCAAGNAKVTKGFLLPAKHVVHAVGPVWQGGKQNEPELLASCYRRALELATLVDAKTIAFPCISTGVYGYPVNQAARIAVAQVRAYVSENGELGEVVFCCFSDKDLAVYEALL